MVGWRVRAAAGIALVSVGVLVGGNAAGAAPSCGDAVLADWEDGRIDGAYTAECYRDALASMPEDVRVYTSATDDIARARRESLTSEARSRRLSGRTPAPARADAGDAAAPALPGSTAAARALPLSVLLAGSVVVLVGIAGTTSFAAGRLRRRRLARGRAVG
jgi:hypothetical protein